MKKSTLDFETRLASAFEQLENGISREEIIKDFSEDEQEELEEILFVGDFLQAQYINVKPRESALRSALDAISLPSEKEKGREWGELFSSFWSPLFRKKVFIPLIGCFFIGALVIHPVANSPENEIERIEEAQLLQEEIAMDYQKFLKDYEEYEQLEKDIFKETVSGVS